MKKKNAKASRLPRHESRPKLGEQLLNQHNRIARPSQFLWTRGSASHRWLWKESDRNIRNYPRLAFRFTRAKTDHSEPVR
eukprot:g68747.t1